MFFYQDIEQMSFINGRMKAKDRDGWWSILVEAKAYLRVLYQ